MGTHVVGATPGQARVMLVPARASMCAAPARREEGPLDPGASPASFSPPSRKAEMSLLWRLESNRSPPPSAERSEEVRTVSRLIHRSRRKLN